MVAHVTTVCFQGTDVIAVDVQVHIAPGLPSFSLVGLPDKTIVESRERVRCALQSLGMALPSKRILINLSPADLQKEGSHYDLPIALGLLSSLQAFSKEILENYVVLGELALDGAISRVNGALPAALYALGVKKGLICPQSCGEEAAWGSKDIRVLAPSHLMQLVNHFKGHQVLCAPQPKTEKRSFFPGDMADIKGQETPKRALEIAAAGGHNLLMVGPPGSGKSMLASRLPGLLPPLSPREALEVSMVYSIAGSLQEGRLMRHRPFRNPHHSASMSALVGGGTKERPGEISLAHHGVLFLDELPEFQKLALEALRQPLELGKIVIARANRHVAYPARFQLIAAMNPCRCGYLDDPEKSCRRAPSCGQDYQFKISGPLIDRIDMRIGVPAVDIMDLSVSTSGDSSQVIRKRVAKAQRLQRSRVKTYNKTLFPWTNGALSSQDLEETANMESHSKELLTKAALQFKLSARSYYRLLRVARTVADLGESPSIKRFHMAEALSYRHTLAR